jgi:O-methyltransferase
VNKIKLKLIAIFQKIDNFISRLISTKIENELIKKSLKYSFCTTNEHILRDNIHKFKQILKNGFQGAIVECGVEGGISLVFFHNLLEINKIENINIYGFDTFEGVPEPKNFDITNNNMSMFDQFKKRLNPDGSSGWNNVSIEQVKKNISENVKKTNSTLLVKGKVEQTLLKLENIPDKISLLKLDTILYEPTKIELEKLFNRIHKGGMLIIDNYGTYKGIKKAVDEFFINSNYKITYAILTRRAFIYV